MAQRIRFTLVRDGEDIRPYDFDAPKVQIGADADRGDNLLIELPPRLRHVRARVLRSDDYVELEVLAGPVWLQGSKLVDGDVAELNVGDLLVFGTKKERGVRLRFSYAKEAEIVLDDVADWTVSAAPKRKRGKAADEDFAFEEEVDEYAGLNPYEKSVKFYRKQYAKFRKWRAKAARVKYWVSIVSVLWQKIGKIMLTVGGMGSLAFGWYTEFDKREEAEEVAAVSQEREKLGADAEQAALTMSNELREEMRQCGCDSVGGTDTGAIAAANIFLDRFPEETDLVPERGYNMPDRKQRSLASIVSPHLGKSRRENPMLAAVLDRVCTPTKDKERMVKVQAELTKYGLHEAYSFIPFVESLWCELAVSFTGPRGMMQFTRATAQEAFRQVDVTQATIPNYDWAAHNQWLLNKSKKYNGYYNMLAKCPATVVADYRQEFYPNQANAEYPRRLDPNDPRTDWEWATVAAFGWLENLDRFYKNKGFRTVDRIMLAMTAYNQGQAEVQRWIDKAKTIYEVENEASLTFPQVYAGAIARREEVTEQEKRRQIKEGMAYAPKVMGRYLHAAPKLDARGCR